MQERENSGRFHWITHFHYNKNDMYMHRKTLRLAAALLQKVVDSLAPALTSMLVRGKEVQSSIGDVR